MKQETIAKRLDVVRNKIAVLQHQESVLSHRGMPPKGLVLEAGRTYELWSGRWGVARMGAGGCWWVDGWELDAAGFTVSSPGQPSRWNIRRKVK